VQKHPASVIAHTEAGTGSEWPRLTRNEWDASGSAPGLPSTACSITGNGPASLPQLVKPVGLAPGQARTVSSRAPCLKRGMGGLPTCARCGGAPFGCLRAGRGN
jgi:hypothetical protein